MSDAVDTIWADVGEDDHAAFVKWMAQREHGRRRTIVLAAAILFMPVLVLGGFVARSGMLRLVYEDVLRPMLGAFYVLLVVYLLIIWATPRLAAKQAGKQPGAFGRRRYEAGPEGFRSENEILDVRVRWAGVTEVVEGEQHLFVLTGPHTGFVIPNRSFESAEARKKFVESVRERHRAGSYTTASGA